MIIIHRDGKIIKSNFSNQITGEKMPGDLDSWNYYNTNPNEVVELSYGKLSSRSTTLYHTHAPVSAAINKMTAYAVGPGLIFRSQPDWKTLGIEKEYAKEWGMEFQRLIHYYFLLLNFYEKQSILFRTANIMGDSLLLFDREESENGLPFDLIETGGDQIDWEQTFEKGNVSATLGIVHDKYLRKKGIILDDENNTNVPFTDEIGDQNVIQFYNKKMARQLRGMPLAYKVIALSKNHDRYLDAIIQRAVMETILLGYKKGGNPSDLNDQVSQLANTVTGEIDDETGLKKEADIQEMQGGNIFSFNGDEEMSFTDLKTPSNNFDKMQKAYIEMIGMATDVPPEVLMSMYSTSFTAHKGALNDFIKFYMAKRNTLVKTCNNIVLREIAKYIFTSGQMEMPNNAFFTNPIIQMATLAGNWLGPVPGHINPKVEVEAKALEVKEAFRTRSDVAAEYGNEFDNMIQEWQEQETEWQKMSVEKQTEVVEDQEEELNNQGD